MRRSDLHFANDPRGAVEAESHNGTWLVLAVVGLVIAATVAWAYWARVDQVTNATGRVIASQQNQTVESLEPGIVADILVAEGDQVKAGQELVRIDDTGASSRLGELNSREASLTAELLRLRTHAQNKSKFVIPENLSKTSWPFEQRTKTDEAVVFAQGDYPD